MWFISPALDIIKGLLGWMNKREDVNLEKYKVNGQVDMNAVNAEVAVVTASKDHQRDKWMQWGFVAPTVVWYTAIIIDCVVQRITGWQYDVLALPPQVQYVPQAIIAFLFFHKIFKR